MKNAYRIIDSSVAEIIEEEQQAGTRKIETYQNFTQGLDELKTQLHQSLSQLKSMGKKIAGFGASHSTTTLVYHFEIASFIDYLIDDNVIKQGRFSPGYHLPVYSSDKFYEDIPDYVVILAWQHQTSIIERHKKYHENGGKWIVPLPRLNIF